MCKIIIITLQSIKLVTKQKDKQNYIMTMSIFLISSNKYISKYKSDNTKGHVLVI